MQSPFNNNNIIKYNLIANVIFDNIAILERFFIKYILFTPLFYLGIFTIKKLDIFSLHFILNQKEGDEMNRKILIIHIIGFILTMLVSTAYIVEIVLAHRAFDFDLAIFQTRLQMIIPMYRWFLCWVIFYWWFFVWITKNKQPLRMWLESKILYINIGLLFILYFYDQMIFQPYPGEFVQLMTTITCWTTLIVFVINTIFAYIFKRFAYRLNVISFIFIWIILTSFMYVQTVLFPQM